MQTTKKLGDKGEKIAADYLEKRGYKIIEKNWKYSRIGEIDIIALENSTLVFIEVKYRRSNTFGTAIEAITTKKLEKIYTSALVYLQNSPPKYKNYRIDVIAIDPNPAQTNGYSIQHIKNVSL